MLSLERSFALVYLLNPMDTVNIWEIAIRWLEGEYDRSTIPRFKSYMTGKGYLMKVLDTDATPEEILELFDLFRRNKVAYPDFVTGYIVLEPKDIDTIIKIN